MSFRSNQNHVAYKQSRHRAAFTTNPPTPPKATAPSAKDSAPATNPQPCWPRPIGSKSSESCPPSPSAPRSKPASDDCCKIFVCAAKMFVFASSCVQSGLIPRRKLRRNLRRRRPRRLAPAANPAARFERLAPCAKAGVRFGAALRLHRQRRNGRLRGMNSELPSRHIFRRRLARWYPAQYSSAASRPKVPARVPRPPAYSAFVLVLRQATCRNPKWHHAHQHHEHCQNVASNLRAAGHSSFFCRERLSEIAHFRRRLQ